ncbi:uncharacterized protein LOC106470782 isoform X3 [Limulus polyphemus]|uniref:Uncharacterized protein LOC106470782 isoform X2 n=1 Tax=Limulus polyphemus TaxID=6850 RepID=A0ABM1TGX2_LIMPO|nr:uncharacterized protein LOC106470782 isoform X2 [Limulus polyphemus]XP_022255128.1 uncharacterized protein LOC106470782 isoform X3 [Limulus polyphemus]
MDPMSHRIIEKRRRDRMNNCLADLSRLIPTSYMKKGRGRIEKAEIIEMTIKHLKHLQVHSCKNPSNCDVTRDNDREFRRHYHAGFQECLSEAIRFLVETDRMYSGDQLRLQLVSHLQKHYRKVTEGTCYQNAGVSTENSTDAPIESYTPSESQRAPSTSTTRMTPFYDPPAQTAQEGGEQPPPKVLKPSSDVMAMQSQAETPSQPPKHIELGAENENTSQLREMLQNPGLPIRRFCSNSTNSNINTNTNSIYTSHPFPSFDSSFPHPPQFSPSAFHKEVYKFKKNIKERFTADQQQHITPVVMKRKTNDTRCFDNLKYPQHNGSSPCGVRNSSLSPVVPAGYLPFPLTHSPLNLHNSELMVKLPDKSSPEGGLTTAGQWDNTIDSVSSNSSNSSSSRFNPSPSSAVQSTGSSSGYSTNSDAASYTPKQDLNTHYKDNIDTRVRSPSPHLPSWSPGVPIFALHPKGTFYVPLTIDAELLAPFVSGLDNAIPVLHPVSISVNFSFSRSVKGPEKMYSRGSWRPDRYAIAKHRRDRKEVTYSGNPVTQVT